MVDKLGYTKSSLFQIVNGKVSLSEKFVKKLCSFGENGVAISINIWRVIQKQAESFLLVTDKWMS
ncbi:hypothetical protein BACCELL_03789 [Bacteroides cellulosilyticus DSM 14838]|uniref:Uncharacterized protein n=1 Tax=Bacteroides cellulosilyticus DSM 14838 TaxID=537012 RepID=E2NHL2_9BACE|nr:hypothetical protein BACCELL_03789 [Bacteroides cellulosilyticus DSM 14838]